MSNKCSIVRALFIWILGGAAMRDVTLPSAFAQHAQSSLPRSVSAPSPKFEVVSVKPCNAKDMPSGRGRGGARASIDPGRLRLECRTVDDLIHMAYLWFADGKGDSRFGAAGPLQRLFNQPIDGTPPG
jgi:hypothetical protein